MEKPQYQKVKTEQKALEINLNESIYGTFSEIGAGQEVARYFFKVGAAANTIAKTMSAYDKTFSDAIYGTEKSGRYVCESRLYKMLNHEWELLEERLRMEKKNCNFFVFADTVTTINYTKTVKGQGWLGVRFQLVPGAEPSELVIHAKMHDSNTKLQQEAIGILGVNMMYAVFNYKDDIRKLVASLMDSLEGRVSIDLIRLIGPGFEKVDKNLVSLYMVAFGLTNVTIFDEEGLSIHASEFLYKKSLMVVRGNFKPPTLVTQDVIKSSFKQFKKEKGVKPDKAHLITEITLDYLKSEDGILNIEDFKIRAKLLTALGYKVLISNHNNHQMLINYMSDYKIRRLGLVTGVRELEEIIHDKFHQNQDGRLLVALGELFNKNIKIYVYPAKDKNTGEIITAHTMKIPEGMKYLYQHLLESKQIVEVEKFNEDILDIYPSEVLRLIGDEDPSWEEKVPEEIKLAIKEDHLFARECVIPVNP